HRTVKSRVKRKLAAQRRERLDAALTRGDGDPPEVDADAPPEEAKRFPFHVSDLVYRHVTTDVRRESTAVVMCIMDTSGSMDTMKKYLARSFFFLLYQFIATKY